MAIEQVTFDKVKELKGDYLKNTPYDIATAFGFNRNKDRKDLAIDAGIKNYTGQVSENLKIKKMLLGKLEELKSQSYKNVIDNAKNELSEIKGELFYGGQLPEVKIIIPREENIAVQENIEEAPIYGGQLPEVEIIAPREENIAVQENIEEAPIYGGQLPEVEIIAPREENIAVQENIEEAPIYGGQLPEVEIIAPREENIAVQENIEEAPIYGGQLPEVEIIAKRVDPIQNDQLTETR